MEPSASLLALVVLLGCLWATITDLAMRRIPNPIIIAIVVAALVFHGWHGIVPLIGSVGAMALVLVVGTFAHSRGWLGGGDVKLAAAVAAAFSFPDAIAFMLYTMVGGGILALIWIAATRRSNILANCRGYFISISAGLMPLLDTAGTRRLPYALAITSGALLVYASHAAMPFLQLRLHS